MLEAASELFFRDGYAAVGVAELCARADVRKGSFYHWFPSKQALAVEVAERSWERLRVQLVEDVFVLEDRSLLGCFEAYAALLSESLRSHHDEVLGCRFGNLALELSIGAPAIRQALVAIFDDLTALFERAVAVGVERGEVAPDTEPRFVATQVCAQMEGLMLLAKTYQDPTVVEDLVPAVGALVGSR